MKQEVKRCQMAFEEAEKGQDVAMICSGDAGVYGMAGLIYEVGREYPEIKLRLFRELQRLPEEQQYWEHR